MMLKFLAPILLALCAVASAQTKPALPPATQPAATQPVDDAPAIAAALNSTGLFYAAPGHTYNILSLVQVSGRSVTIVGPGTFLAAASLPLTSAGDMFQFVNCPSVTIDGPTFDQNARQRGAASDANAIRIGSCQNVYIGSATFKDAPLDAIRLCATNPADATTAPSNVQIVQCIFDGAHRNLISIIAGHGITIAGNTFSGAIGAVPKIAIDIEPNAGDALGQCRNISIIDNTATNCALGFVTENGRSRGTSDITFAHNHTSASVGLGIGADCLRARICDNHVATWISVGSGADDCTICRNTVIPSSATAGGIYADETLGGGVVATNPVGQRIIGNTVSPGTINVAGCFGHVTLMANVGTVVQ